ARPAPRAAAGAARTRAAASLLFLVELLLHAAQEGVEALLVDDLVELGAVVLEHALVVGEDVVDDPAVLPEHLVLERDVDLLPARRREQRGVHGRLVAGLLFLVVLDRVVGAAAPGAVELLEVAALHEVAQRGDELLPLLGGEGVPVPRQRAPRQLAVIEE